MLVTGGSCLPLGLTGTYDDYKLSTKRVIKWLQENGATCETDNTTSSCKALLRLAAHINAKGIVAPPEIVHALRESIERREHLHKWFRQQSSRAEEDEADARHKFFNQVLETIHGTLRIRHLGRDGPRPLNPRIATTSTMSDQAILDLRNRFALLCDETDRDKAREMSSEECFEATTDPPQPRQPGNPVLSSADDLDILKDDIDTTYIEAFLALINLDSLLEVLNSSWAQAGHGEISFSVAAAVSHSVLAWAEADFYVLNTTPWPHELKTFETFIDTLKRSGAPPGWRESDLPASTECTWGDGLTLPCFVMDSFIDNPFQPQVMPTFSNALANVGVQSSKSDDAQALLQLLQCMVFADDDVDTDLNNNIYLQMTRSWFQNLNGERELNRIKVAFYLRHLLESLRAYHFANGSASSMIAQVIKPSANARITVLKFAMEVHESFKALATSPYAQRCCTDSLGGTAEVMQSWLSTFLKTPRYDIYFQCPTVSTEIAINIMHYLRRFGCKIANHKHFLASILHVYNALLVIGDIKPIHILDELCSYFEDIVFLGKAPLSNFSSIFARHRNGKVQYGESRGERGQDLGSNGKWAMMIPDDKNSHHVETNRRRFEDTIDTSIMFSTTLGVHTTDYYWAKVLNLQDHWVKTNDETLAGLTSWLQSHHINDHPLLYVREQLTNEFNGRPIPCINPLLAISKTPSTANTSPHCNTMDLLTPELDRDAVKDPASQSVGENDLTSTATLCDLPTTAAPHIRLSVKRPTCSCHRDMSHTRVLAQERNRGTGLLPVMRLNLVAVWLACAEAVAHVNKASGHNTVSEEGIVSKEPTSCLCLVDEFLLSADVYVSRQKKSMKFSCPKLKKEWIWAIEAFREKKAEDFLWKWM